MIFRFFLYHSFARNYPKYLAFEFCIETDMLKITDRLVIGINLYVMIYLGGDTLWQEQ